MKKKVISINSYTIERINEIDTYVKKRIDRGMMIKDKNQIFVHNE